MFIPFLATAAVATTFVQLGTMSAEIGTRTLVLKAVSIVFMATLLSTAGLEHADRKVVQPLSVSGVSRRGDCYFFAPPAPVDT